MSSFRRLHRVCSTPLVKREHYLIDWPIRAARSRENAAFVKLMGGPANAEALKAFAEKRPPDFTTLPPGW